MYSLNQFGTSCLNLAIKWEYKRRDCASGSPTRHFVPHPRQNQKGHERQDCKNGTTSCLTGNQKVSGWIAVHLQQIDGLQIQHFVPHPATNRQQLNYKRCTSGNQIGQVKIIQIAPPILDTKNMWCKCIYIGFRKHSQNIPVTST